MSNTLPVKEFNNHWEKQPMLRPKIGAIKINCSLGVAGAPLDRAKIIIQNIADQQPSETFSKNTYRSFGIRKGQPVGVTVTVRGKKGYKLLMSLFHAKDYKLKRKSIDQQGNFGFGINEHIDIPDQNYDPNLGIIGFDVTVQMERAAGYRVKYRKDQKRKIGSNHTLTPQETMIFLQENYGIEFV